MQREQTLHNVTHPDPLRIAGRQLTLIEDPLADVLRDGDRVLGWGGDPRLALYLDHPGREWVLVRLEHDNVYRIALGMDAGPHSGVEVVAHMVSWLVEHDSQRGYDVLADVIAKNNRREAVADAKATEQNEELALRLQHGFRKDGVI